MNLNKKKYLFQLNHPAHFHLFKNTIDILQGIGHEVLISIKDKDILKNLLKDYDYKQLSVGYRKKFIVSIAKSLYQRDIKLYKIVKEFEPDLMIGTSPEIGQISPFLKIPSLFFGEDDVNLSLGMYLGAFSCYPFFSHIVSPFSCNNKQWNKKTTKYNGFQKLAYLHPNRFTPDRKKINTKEGQKYFLLRFANLSAYHDINAKGITNKLGNDLINILNKHGEIIISSEREMPIEFEKYRFRGDLNNIHHYLYYSDLYIGDSQSMAVEAAILGTPGIRFNDFVGKIGVLEELENKYKLTKGINSSNPKELIDSVYQYLNNGTKENWQEKRKELLNDKIDVTAFMVWFIENYPQSVKIMKENPDYQYTFK